MSRKATNQILQKAKQLKSDEFYTQLVDIENELQYYKQHFKNKVVFCNCDDARVSNFFKYFFVHFQELGLKKLISACYMEPEISSNSNKISKGFYCEYEGKKDWQTTIDGLKFFKGDGDFRSKESIQLLKEADVVVTNPPFSLFREFVAQLIEHSKKFLIIGNINAIIYKNIFTLIKNNKVWLGMHLGRGISSFIVPRHYELYGTETKIDSLGNRLISPNNCLWLTNLDYKKRHEILPLTKKYNKNKYELYDNFDGINVNRTIDIPLDYRGSMGVPITFLHKFNPKQFEIIGFRKGNDGKDLSVNGKCPYFRVLIRHKKDY
ncbi:adenine-specific methyltransferase EcoRI family protein [Helicobacter pylori]|nr:adenine-specific methyltransferase EcoRI family protein [Helicobacter pylori]